MKHAYIRWRDAYDMTKGEWADTLPETIECIIESVGFVVRETADFVVICHSLGADGMMQGAFAIPTCCVLEHRTIDNIERGNPTP